MQHIVSVAFDFDDAAVSKKIQGTVEKAVIDKITKDIESKIFEQDWGYNNYNSNTRDPSTDTLSTWTNNLVRKIFEENRDVIIDKAAKHLCESYKRSKVWKEAAGGAMK